MLGRSKLFFTTIFIVISASMFSSTLSAQSIWLNQGRENSFAIEILKPDLENSNFVDYSFLSSAIFLSGRFLLGDNVVLVGELPFAHANQDIAIFNFLTGATTQETNEAQTLIGNPYLGLELGNPNSSTFTELGLRLPITPENKSIATEFGISSDFDRFEAFTPDVLTLTGKINSRQKRASQLVTHLRGGPTLLINTAGTGDDAELFFDYSA